jgi:hypothetical protein
MIDAGTVARVQGQDSALAPLVLTEEAASAVPATLTVTSWASPETQSLPDADRR